MGGLSEEIRPVTSIMDSLPPGQGNLILYFRGSEGH